MCRGENTMKEWKQSKKAQLVWAVEDNEEHTFKTKNENMQIGNASNLAGPVEH